MDSLFPCILLTLLLTVQREQMHIFCIQKRTNALAKRISVQDDVPLYAFVNGMFKPIFRAFHRFEFFRSQCDRERP